MEISVQKNWELRGLLTAQNRQMQKLMGDEEGAVGGQDGEEEGDDLHLLSSLIQKETSSAASPIVDSPLAALAASSTFRQQ